MKKIKRTKDMSDWSKYIATDKDGKIFEYDATDLHISDNTQWVFGGHNGNKYSILLIKPYCKNWEQSLRRITDKPARKAKQDNKRN